MRKTIEPEREGCTDKDARREYFGLFGKRYHDWRYSTSWNGNSKNVLPFEGRRTGIGRGGWRCYDCGEFVWDETDAIYALKQAYYTSLLPDFSDLMRGGTVEIRYQSVPDHEKAVKTSIQREKNNDGD